MQAGLEFWAPHVAAMEQESVPTAEYAKRHGLALHSLYYWRQKIKAAAQTPGLPGRRSAFVALTVGAPVPAQQPGSCTLVLGTGVRMELPALPAPEWLAAPRTMRRGSRSAILPPWVVLRHIVNHSTYHRGQVASKLKRLGIEQPATDFVFWAFEQIPQKA